MNREIRFTIVIVLTLLLPFVSSNLKAQTDNAGFAYQKPLFDFDYANPVFKLENEQLINTNRFLRYEVLTGYREGVKPIQGQYGTNFSSTEDKEHGVINFKVYNLSIVDVLVQFYRTPQNQVILNVKDPSKYMYDPKYGSEVDWLRKNGCCFEFAIPRGVFTDGGQTQAMVKQELSHLFNIKFGWEKRMVKSQDTGELKEMNMFVVTEL